MKGTPAGFPGFQGGPAFLWSGFHNVATNDGEDMKTMRRDIASVDPKLSATLQQKSFSPEKSQATTNEHDERQEVAEHYSTLQKIGEDFAGKRLAEF